MSGICDGKDADTAGKCGVFQKIRFPQMVVAGNTVMEHLLCGYPLSGLGEAPFRPFSLELTRQKKSGIFPGGGSLEETEVVVLPGASAFVGADIVAGLYAVSMDQQEGVTLFLDIGTNGEMAIETGGEILATATSAGPAFEGANMTDGVPGIEGAIQQVNLLAGRPVIRTIGNKPPVGICGSRDTRSRVGTIPQWKDRPAMARFWMAPHRIRLPRARMEAGSALPRRICGSFSWRSRQSEAGWICCLKNPV